MGGPSKKGTKKTHKVPRLEAPDNGSAPTNGGAKFEPESASGMVAALPSFVRKPSTKYYAQIAMKPAEHALLLKLCRYYEELHDAKVRPAGVLADLVAKECARVGVATS
jgi:hypothetical protein